MSFMSDTILEKVDIWATGYWMVKETGIIDVSGRLDALLIPTSGDAGITKVDTSKWFWDRMGLIGIEIKVTRADFLNGLRNGQYQRYQEKLDALYIATPSHATRGERICTKEEIPEGAGWLCLNTKVHGWRDKDMMCRKKPVFIDREYDKDVPWRLMHELQLRNVKSERELSCEYHRKLKRVGEIGRYKLHGMIDDVVRKIKNQVETEDDKTN